MTSRDQSDDRSPVRSWNWVSAETFAATPFYKRGVEILKRDWLVFVWKLLADFAARVTTIGLALFVAGLFAVDFLQFITTGAHPFYWLERLGQLVRTPRFITGFTGLWLFSSLLVVAVRALIVAGIWGNLATGLRGDPIRMLATFWNRALEWFADVLSLYLIRFAVKAINLLLGIALAVGLYRAWFGGALSEAPGWLATLLISSSIAFYVAWSGLTRLVFAVAGAPLIVDDVDVGESILRAAAFALDNFWSLYRILIFAAGLLLVPLGVYWVFIMVGNLSVVWPELGPVATALRFAGELLVFVGVSAVGVLFYGALFSFYRCDDEQKAPAEDPFGRGVTLDEFHPDETRNRKQNFLLSSTSPILTK